MKSMLKRALLVVAVIVLVVCSLAACGSKAMSKKEYMEQINKLSTVSEDFFVAMAEWAGNALTMDTEEAKAGVENMREITKGYGEVAKIDNPPKEYEEVHEKLVVGLNNLVDALDVYFDSLIAGLDGTLLSDEENQAVRMDVMECIDVLTEVLEEMD